MCIRDRGQVLVNERQHFADAVVNDGQIVRGGLQVGGQRVQVGAGRLQVGLQAAHTLRQAVEAGPEAAQGVVEGHGRGVVDAQVEL